MVAVGSAYSQIITVKIQDGTISRQVRFGDLDQLPLGLAVSRIDRLAWNVITQTDSSSSSINTESLSASPARTKKNLFVASWDA
jgi:hypothetical protein